MRSPGRRHRMASPRAGDRTSRSATAPLASPPSPSSTCWARGCPDATSTSVRSASSSSTARTGLGLEHRQHDPPCHTGANLAQHRPAQRAADTDTPPANCYAAAASLSSRAPNILQDNVTVQAPVFAAMSVGTQSLSGLSPSGTYGLARYRVSQDNSSGRRLTLRDISLCSACRSAADWFRGLLTRC
jgi:hypothetical protein